MHDLDKLRAAAAARKKERVRAAARRTAAARRRERLEKLRAAGLTLKGKPDRRRGPAACAPEGSPRRRLVEQRARERAGREAEFDSPEYQAYIRRMKLTE